MSSIPLQSRTKTVTLKWASRPPRIALHRCSPKIVAELAKLGIEVAKSAVEQYPPCREKPPSPTWRTLLGQHVREPVAIYFFLVPSGTCPVLFVFLVPPMIDGDGLCGQHVARRIESLGIEEVVATPASPCQNAYVERVDGTLRQELLDHVIMRNEE